MYLGGWGRRGRRISATFETILQNAATTLLKSTTAIIHRDKNFLSFVRQSSHYAYRVLHEFHMNFFELRTGLAMYFIHFWKLTEIYAKVEIFLWKIHLWECVFFTQFRTSWSGIFPCSQGFLQRVLSAEFRFLILLMRCQFMQPSRIPLKQNMKIPPKKPTTDIIWQ